MYLHDWHVAGAELLIAAAIRAAEARGAAKAVDKISELLAAMHNGNPHPILTRVIEAVESARGAKP